MSNMVIATNVLALNSHRALKGSGGALAKSSEKLSSGYRINRAADDAAGLAISEKMRSQIRGLDQASRNSQDGISLIQTAEGALQETEDMLQRMRELTVQASNGTLTQSDRAKIALELDELSDEIDATSVKTEFNTNKLIDGTWKSNSLYLQTGANQEQGLSFNIDNMDSKVLGVTKSNIGDVVRGNQGILEPSRTVDFTDTTLDVFTDGVGSYDFGDGKSLTITKDGMLQVTGEWKDTANGLVLKEGLHDLNALGDMEFEVNGADGAKVEIKANSNEIIFTLATSTEPATIGSTAVFDNGSIVEIGTGEYTFKNVEGLRLVDANGKSTAVDANKTYTDAELEDMKLVSADGQMFTFDSSGVLETGSTYTASIKFRSGIDANGSEVSEGQEISKLTKTIDNAIEMVSSQRAKLGAYQNRLEHTIKNLDTSSENLSASESRIRDTDMAKEMMKLTQANILQQAATAMLAQANQAPQNVLQLLG